ncbi:unnamed protein product [Blepharisma stoltei]|uniref:Uncharacterized protein n=1 Tax=Blepharisma stoltei TaxID=1481888 RepID=A0AAU9IS79_9CILI|nr:unnamed protein product [Blepharisma stoltei]
MDLSEGFFLSIHNSLLEFTGKLWVTSINSLLVAIIILKPKENANQIALISDDGEIVSHSPNFSKLAGKPDLIGFKLKTLFLNSEYFDLKPFVPYHIKQNSGEFLLTLSYYEIYHIKISYVSLIHDSEEIRKWENFNEAAQNDEKYL